MADHSQEIAYDAIEEWFLAEVKELGIRGFARNHQIDTGVVSRNWRRIREKKVMAVSFTKRIARIIVEERADGQRR